MASIFLELFKAFGFGVMAFFIAPLIAALLPWEYAKRVVGIYQSIAMSLLGRAIMLKRSHGGLKLKKSSFDAQVGSEKIRIGGEEKHFRDPRGLMSTFRGYPFGLAHEDRAVIVDARTAFFGRRFAELVNNEQLRSESGRLKAFFAIPEGLRELVNLDDVKAILPNSTPPGAVSRVDTYAEKSQAGFDSKQFLIDQFQWFMALGVGFGIMWFAKEAGGTIGGGSGGSIVPIFLGGLPI